MDFKETYNDRQLCHKNCSGQCRRRRLRFQPRQMTAVAVFEQWAEKLELQIVDFSLFGIGCLMLGKAPGPAPGNRLRLNLVYKNTVLNDLDAEIVHRKHFGTFSHLGLRLSPDSRQAVRLKALQYTLTLEQPLNVRKSFLNGNRVLRRHL